MDEFLLEKIGLSQEEKDSRQERLEDEADNLYHRLKDDGEI